MASSSVKPTLENVEDGVEAMELQPLTEDGQEGQESQTAEEQPLNKTSSKQCFQLKSRVVRLPSQVYFNLLFSPKMVVNHRFSQLSNL